MKSALFLLIPLLASLLSSSNPAVAGTADLRHHFIQENLPGHQVKIRVIEEDSSLRETQNQISQHVVFSTVVSADQAASVLSQFPQHPVRFQSLSMRDTVAPARPLWVPGQNSWTAQDEDNYSQWFATQITQDFDIGTGLLADCADISILFRWVYAREHKLPVANSLAGSGKLVGHFSSNPDWDALPENPDWTKDERFKAALRYVFANTYTRSVDGDLYPTQMSQKYIRPGSLFMLLRPDSGHVQTVKSVDATKGILVFWGREPGSENIFQSPPVVEAQNKLIYGMWRWPVLVNGTWQLTPGIRMPGYSSEQSKQSFKSDDAYRVWVDGKLGIVESDENRLTTLGESFIDSVSSRLETTAESIPDCVYTHCAPGSTIYNTYSTVASDARLVTTQKDALALISKMGMINPAVQTLLQRLKSMGPIVYQTELTYLELFQDPSALAKLKSDPRLPFSDRWGITAPAGVSPETFTFLTESAALRALLIQRNYFIHVGLSLCANSCDPNSASYQTYNTAAFDSGIQQVINDVLKCIQAPGFDQTALTKTRTEYQYYFLNVNNHSCGGLHGTCTYDDAIFSPTAETRLKNWSSNPGAPIQTRWGF